VDKKMYVLKTLKDTNYLPKSECHGLSKIT